MPFCGWVLTQAAPQWPRGPGQRAGGQVPWGSWLCKDPGPLQAGSHPTAHCMLVGSGPGPPAWKAGPGQAVAAGCLADGSWSPAPAGPGPASERGWRRGRVRGGKEGAPAGLPVCMWPAPRLTGRGSGSEPGSRGPARSASSSLGTATGHLLCSPSRGPRGPSCRPACTRSVCCTPGTPLLWRDLRGQGPRKRLSRSWQALRPQDLLLCSWWPRLSPEQPGRTEPGTPETWAPLPCPRAPSPQTFFLSPPTAAFTQACEYF